MDLCSFHYVSCRMNRPHQSPQPILLKTQAAGPSGLHAITWLPLASHAPMLKCYSMPTHFPNTVTRNHFICLLPHTTTCTSNKHIRVRFPLPWHITHPHNIPTNRIFTYISKCPDVQTSRHPDNRPATDLSHPCHPAIVHPMTHLVGAWYVASRYCLPSAMRSRPRPCIWGSSFCSSSATCSRKNWLVGGCAGEGQLRS